MAFSKESPDIKKGIMKIHRTDKDNGTEEILDRLDEITKIIEIIAKDKCISRDRAIVLLRRGETFETISSVYKKIKKTSLQMETLML